MRITVHVRSDVAAALHGVGEHTAASTALLDAARRLGVQLHPMHPATSAATLADQFMVEVSGEPEAKRVLEVLRALDSIKSAYLKPPEMLP